MTRLDFCQLPTTVEAVKIGMVDPFIYNKYIRYRLFLDLKKSGKKTSDAVSEVCETTRCKESTVYRAIKFFTVS